MTLFPLPYEILLRFDSTGSPNLNLFALNDLSQPLGGMDQAIDADSVVGHLVIDVGIDASGSGTEK